MRVTLTVPPAICLPNQLYFAMPLLAGALKRRGHRPSIVDLNLAAADRLLDEATAASLVEEHVATFGAAATEGIRQRLLDGFRCKNALRNEASFMDPAAFRGAFWEVVDILAAFYQLDPILSPYDEAFYGQMRERLREREWTAMRGLYDRGFLREILDTGPEMVGICVSFPEQCVEAMRLAKRLRAHDEDLVVVVGGPLVTRLPERWLGGDFLFDFADYVVLGDGETAIASLADALEGHGALEDVPNLVWRDREGAQRRSARQGYVEAMDELPVPDFEGADMARYFQPHPIYPLMTSRGCYWGKCAMCSIGYRENFRTASPAKLQADIDEVVRLGGRYVQLQDSSVPPRSARQFSEIVRDRGADLHWAAWMKFDSCFQSREYCETLRDGGCKSLQMGFESSDQRLLDLMCKGYEHANLLEMLQNLKDARISTELLWFIGFPTQTKRDVLDTVQFLFENRDLFGLTSFVGDFGLHPDSDVYFEPDRFGVRVVSQENGRCTYEIDEGLSMQDGIELKAMLSGNNNRTLTCNGSHLIHLADVGPDLSGLERPIHVPPEVAAFCARDADGA